jgi:hypothetical protein
MAKVDMYLPATIPDVFSHEPGDTLFTEMLSFTMLQNLVRMQEAGFQWDDGQMTPEELAVFSAAWTAQTRVIEQQSKYLKDIKSTFNAKHQALPSAFKWSEFVKSDIFDWLVKTVLALIPGTIDDALYYAITEYGISLLGMAVELLEILYTSGGLLCDRMRDENTKVQHLPMSKENYRLRSQVIRQHDMSIQSMMMQISHAEQQIQQNPTTAESATETEHGTPRTVAEILEDMSLTLKRIEASEHVIDIDGRSFYTKSLVYDENLLE